MELPGRGATRIWECVGPPGAPVLMLIHGVTFTAELNWGKSFASLGQHFRVVAMDLRGHGDGISVGAGSGWKTAPTTSPRWRWCSAWASSSPWATPWAAWWPSCCPGGTPRCCRAWCCAPPRATSWGSPAEKLAVLALPAAAAAIRLNPFLQPMSAELFGMALLGPVDDPAEARHARAQLRRTPLGTAISAVQAVCEFSSHSWIGQVSVPTAVLVTTRDRVVPVSRQLKLARAIPGATVHEVAADHAACVTVPEVFNPVLLQACWSVTAARALTCSQT